MKLKKFFIRTVLAVSLLNFMNVNLTFAQVPSKQALVQTKEAKIKTDKMDNTGNIDKNMDKKGKTTILAKEENIIPSKTLDNATENKVENVEFKSAILNWPEIPNAVMYELIVKNIDTQEVLFTKYNIYASGYQLDNSEVNLSQNLKWQVRGLDENKVPVSDYTKPRLLHKGEMYKLNWQNKGDEYKLEDFSRREYTTYLVTKDVEISPLKITTHFDKMDYMPVYPVYSWVPVKNADHYKIDVFYVPKYDFNNIEKIASYTCPQGMDYYDNKAYTKKGLYFFNVQAYDKNNHKLAEAKNSYFTVKQDNVKVAALGDSITHGGGAVSTPPSATLYNWETYANLPVLNIGFSGNLTSNMLNRFDNDVLSFNPKILVIMGGVNDIRTGVKSETVINNLTSIKQKCQQHNIIPVFLTVTSVNPSRMKSVINLDISEGWDKERLKINEWIEKQPYHVDVASGLMDEQGYLADNMTTDGLHPDFEGKKHIGELVGDYLRVNFPDIVNN